MTKTKKKRVQLPPAVKQTIQRQGRALTRQFARNAERELDLAREALQRGRMDKQGAAGNANYNAVVSGLRAVLGAVASSWGIKVPITLETGGVGSTPSARTDFKSVYVGYPLHRLDKKAISKAEVGKFDVPTLKTVIAEIKALGYHEIGHIMFTVPPSELFQSVGLVAPPTGSTLHKAWNILEDQRMENALVSESPVISGYLTTLTLRHILNQCGRSDEVQAEQYLLVYGRRYINAKFRKEMRAKFIAKFGEAIALDVERLIRTYMSATDEKTMVDATLEFAEVLASISPFMMNDIPQGTDYHTNSVSRPSDDQEEQEQERQQRQQRLSKSAAKEEQQDDDATGGGGEQKDGQPDEQQDEQSGSDGGDSGDEQGDDGSGQAGDSGQEDTQPVSGDSGQDVREQEGTGNGGGEQSYSPSGSSTKKEDVSDALNESMEELFQDESLLEAIRDIHDRAYSNESSMARVTEYVMGNTSRETEAETVAVDIASSLEVLVADCAPVWNYRQTVGIIDPFVYRTRPSGSTEYRRNFNDTGDSGMDISVTLMLDTSGSMDGNGSALGAAAFATKRACEMLEIPCTVMTFCDWGRLLWDNGDKAEHLSLRTGGGTDPTSAFDRLDDYRYDKRVHLVVMMTDGQFNFRGCNSFRTEGRHFVGLAYGHGATTRNLVMNEFDYARQISNLMEIPESIRDFVTAFIR